MYLQMRIIVTQTVQDYYPDKICIWFSGLIPQVWN